jgi:hypothetical protein
MACCELYQNNIDKRNKILSIFPNLDINEYSNLIQIGIYYMKKFIVITNDSSEYKTLGKKGKTIFEYNELQKNLLHLPKEILLKIF